MRVLVGTSGYSYKEWKGAFYPEKLKAAEMLRYYSSRLTTVEINNTFYRMPTRALLEKWLGEVPETFTFVLKAPQRITHQRRLKDAQQEVSHFYETAAAMGERLGAVLFQLPPYLKKDAARLRDFLAALPPGPRAAFEFRHESWFDDEVYEALRAGGAALCVADADETPEAGPPLVATAAFGYLRLRRADYEDAALARWAERVRAQPWDTAFVFFKHEDAGHGARLAESFGALARDGS
jgi:uncharacterized protein YecE (DUF72 family)